MRQATHTHTTVPNAKRTTRRDLIQFIRPLAIDRGLVWCRDHIFTPYGRLADVPRDGLHTLASQLVADTLNDLHRQIRNTDAERAALDEDIQRVSMAAAAVGVLATV